LRKDNARSRLILDSAIDHAIITLDIEGRITGWNAGAQQIMGYAEAEILGRSGEIVFTSDDRAAGRFTVELCRAIEHGRATNERWHLRQDGTRFWASGTMMPLLDADGAPQGFLNILRDRTEARAEAERRELLMAEMDHRIKNTFSTVQAVAIQTGRHAPTTADFLATFGARLKALARSHEVLIRSGWENAPLRDVVEGALAAYGGEPGRIAIEGMPVLLPADLVVTVSLAFHELATNAVKHGALSRPSGSVSVAWAVGPAGKGARRVEIVWRERGGPPVRPPERRGFGSQLLEQGIRSQANGTVQLDFQPEGLECRIGLPRGTGPQCHHPEPKALFLPK
jgi:PAS domain S-box-containing protein